MARRITLNSPNMCGGWAWGGMLDFDIELPPTKSYYSWTQIWRLDNSSGGRGLTFPDGGETGMVLAIKQRFLPSFQSSIPLGPGWQMFSVCFIYSIYIHISFYTIKRWVIKQQRQGCRGSIPNGTMKPK